MRNPQDVYLRKLLIWRAKYVSDRQFIYLLSIVVGLMSGLSAVALKNAVYWVQRLLFEGVAEVRDYLFMVYPAVGIIIVYFIVKYVIRTKVGHGIPNMLYAISRNNGNIGKKDTWASILTASITVGFGGSVGLEGPTVATAGALSSNLGKVLRLDYKKKKLLIGMAASGALAAIFNAPIAAIVFALEVIMIDLTATSMIPLLLSSATAAVTSRLLLSDDYLFHFSVIEAFGASDLIFYLLLGIVAGLISVHFTSIYFFTERVLGKLNSKFLKALIGGALIGVLIYVFPQLYGEGFETINAYIIGDIDGILEEFVLFDVERNMFIVIALLFLLPVLKALAASITLNSGGVGGIFAPSLFIGSTTGFAFSYIINQSGIAQLSQSNFTLVGMGGVMAGVLQAPLTGVFLIAEITGGYELFLPLMITATIAFISVKYFTPFSIYTRQLAARGELITHHKDQAILTLMQLEKEIEKDFSFVRPYDKLSDLVKTVAGSKRNLFPVVDEQNTFLGVVNLNDIRSFMFDTEKHDTMLVHEMMTPAHEHIFDTDSMDTVMKKFDQSEAWNLPVVTNDVKYIGFVSKSRLFSAYRKLLRDFYEEGD
ncbi:MAG TPA: chloride channel protein [Flavobacteriales bacterium]|jgi:CIC family chloride channel protein|nr:chloride channel protein [Flavobacteriales bacterium]